MTFPRRWAPLLCLLAVSTLLLLLEPVHRKSWHGLHQNDTTAYDDHSPHSPLKDGHPNPSASTNTVFRAGTVKPVGQPYTRTLVIPRTSSENTDWVQEYFKQDRYFDYKIYVVDVVGAPLSPPKNKGHEGMVYLTYIIDHYHNLSDVNIFVHSHRIAWHNNALLDGDAVQVISRLSSERVQREGYMNLRCHWDPGCPSWMHPGMVEEDVGKQEQTMLAKSWSDLFPLDPIPNVLAQPCCAQFAVSGDRLRSIPLARYVLFRDWLLGTDMSDYFSGRVFEYIWQFIFTGQNVVCPKEHVCYCDGFGICFGGEKEYDIYQEKVKERERMEEELKTWKEMNSKWSSGEKGVEQPEPGKDTEMTENIETNIVWCEMKKQEAKERGDVPKYRAQDVGREWNDGDGF